MDPIDKQQKYQENHSSSTSSRQHQQTPECFIKLRKENNNNNNNQSNKHHPFVARKSVVKMFHSLKLKLTTLIFVACIIGPQFVPSIYCRDTDNENNNNNNNNGLSAATIQEDTVASAAKSDKSIPSNHRMEPEDNASGTINKGRQSRQYDSLGPMSTSGTGNYASIAAGAGDSGAYLGASSGTGSPAALTSYAASGDIGSYSVPSTGSYHHTDLSAMQFARAGGYPSQMHPSAYGPPLPPAGLQSAAGMYGPMLGSASGFGGGGGLFSGVGGGPLMAKGFDLAEVVCSAIAVAVGAVIVGAPFILLYLFIANQVQGGSGGGLGGAGGGPSISLTGPTSSTNVSGRRKRQTSFPEVLLKQLSPLINSEQVTHSLKMLMSSMAKYQL